MRQLIILALGFTTACAGFGPADPVTTDPEGHDAAFPAALIETAIPSGEDAMNAIVYVAPGEGPHPTVVLLHGFPGNERNLDLAQAIRRSGWNVVFFHYRGAWGSPGAFSFAHVLEDVASAVVWAGDVGNATAFRIDPERIALIGHSMGGFAALRAGTDLETVDCIASISGANFGPRASAAAADAEYAAAVAARLDAWSAPLAGTSGEALVAELAGDVEEFDLVRRAPTLAGKRLLLIAGSRDETTPPVEHHAPLVAALEAAAATRLEHVVLDADQAYSSRRIALAHQITDWLETGCGVEP